MFGSSGNTWNLSLGTIRGVPIIVHSSFFLLIAWVLFTNEGGFSSAFLDILFLCAVFFCVLLHECGHVFTGQWFGVATRDIILYPFGGVATILSLPTPMHELIIAIAGPLVSFAIAGLLYLIATPEDPFLFQLMQTNLALGAFNLIPAIPMDGGRILRAILALANISAATTIAARVSQVCSICMAIIGFYFHAPILIFISFFVFLGSMQELMQTKTKKALADKIVSDLYIEKDKLYCFHHSTTVAEALQLALRSLQEVFPVVYLDELLGLVSRQSLIEQAALSSENQYIGSIADKNLLAVSPDLPLADAVALAASSNAEVLPVIRDDTFLGLLFLSTLNDVLLVDSFKGSNTKTDDEEDFFP